ncbi:hypothetical protein SLS53_000341 [Cytospora paraplurivora]|uniref:Uncharacterized protein n=1 Tax=Cytospora paraplurivora TaxID=2898453 RepID=A0AAN9YPG2_9PEZI
MVSRILFWTGFGIATRLWQLGLEMRPLWNRGSLWVYPIFAGTGASFGYWLESVDKKQTSILEERKEAILAKRARRAAREAAATEAA